MYGNDSQVAGFNVATTTPRLAWSRNHFPTLEAQWKCTQPLILMETMHIEKKTTRGYKIGVWKIYWTHCILEFAQILSKLFNNGWMLHWYWVWSSTACYHKRISLKVIWEISLCITFCLLKQTSVYEFIHWSSKYRGIELIVQEPRAIYTAKWEIFLCFHFDPEL